MFCHVAVVENNNIIKTNVIPGKEIIFVEKFLAGLGIKSRVLPIQLFKCQRLNVLEGAQRKRQLCQAPDW